MLIYENDLWLYYIFISYGIYYVFVWWSKVIIGFNGKILGFDLNSNLMIFWYIINFIIEWFYFYFLFLVWIDWFGDIVNCLWYFVLWIFLRIVFFVSGVDDCNIILLEYVVFC